MWVTLLTLLLRYAGGDVYTEELRISRLPSDHIMTAFRFVTTSGEELGPNYSLFPRIVSELISAHSVLELSFALSQGRWYSSRWGSPPQPNRPTGAAVHAWIRGNETEVDAKWGTLINSLNGLFCTAMTAVVPGLTSSPNLVYTSGPWYSEEMHVRYSAVGKETVCTENMTPWKKLLPCKQHGLVTLLNPLKMYESVYHTIGMELRPQSELSHEATFQAALQSTKGNFELLLYMYTVFDIPAKNSKSDWSIVDLFSRRAVGSCNAATSSRILVELEKGIHLSPLYQGVQDGAFAVYDLQKNDSGGGFTVSASYDSSPDVPAEEHCQLSLSSFIGGAGQQSGTLVSVLSNGGPLLRITYTHQLPWYMLVYYHSLSVSCKGLFEGNHLVATIHRRLVTPAIARKRPTLIELDVDLPGRSECRIQLEFEKAFLRIREYPPDANHGMYVPAAVVTFEALSRPSTQRSQKRADGRATMHGNVLLLALPVPDFSMPFNVICFVMTTVSLCFGPIHSFSTKILIPVNSVLPSSSLTKKLFRVLLLILLGLAFYAQYREMSLHEIRRSIEQFFEKMNSV